MNCRQAEHELFASQDGARDETRRAALGAHVDACPACRKLQAALAGAVDALRTEAAQVRVPDAELEWQKLRREIRGGAESRAAASRGARAAWFALPLAAAAAVALMVMNPAGQDASPPPKRAEVARVEKPSSVVFVDDQSGFVFVWAEDDSKHI